MEIILFTLITLGIGGFALKTLLHWQAENFDLPELPSENPPSLPKNQIGRKILLNPPNQPHQREPPRLTSSFYNQPMDIIPDDEILPPTREINGINGEE
ncbi:MAG: hypothetical protein RLZZ580_2928 [Cyanobacteriota bacterium]|jgi:hypothetical protein|nr:hypothetical protein [Microcystis aeruginosa SX13-01]